MDDATLVQRRVDSFAPGYKVAELKKSDWQQVNGACKGTDTCPYGVYKDELALYLDKSKWKYKVVKNGRIAGVLVSSSPWSPTLQSEYYPVPRYDRAQVNSRDVDLADYADLHLVCSTDKGLGAVLLKAAEELAKRDGRKYLLLEAGGANAACKRQLANSFYKPKGFKPVEVRLISGEGRRAETLPYRGDYEADAPALMLRKEL